MLNGKLVGLRAVEEVDLPKLKEWRNNAGLRKYFRETSELSDKNQQAWFHMISQKDTTHKMFSIVSIESGELLGACGLCYIDWVNRSADFSIYLGYQDIYIDDKLSIDAASIMVDYGFNVLNLHRLWAEIYSIDEPKKIFFKNLEFNLDGTLRETYWYENKWHDSLMYSYLRTDYNKTSK